MTKNILKILLVFILIGGLCLVWAYAYEPYQLNRKSLNISVARDHAALDKLKIVFITDLHYGFGAIDAGYMARLVEKVNAESPDLILLGGDYLGGFMYDDIDRRRQDELLAALARLKARHGVYGVIGNHELSHGGGALKSALEAAGVKMLINQASRIRLPDTDLWLVGLDDFMLGEPDMAAAMKDVPPRAPFILLTHNPATFPLHPKNAVMAFAGHTHGGQVRLPLIGAVYIPTPAPLSHAWGMVKENGSLMYVSNGVGTTALPLRFLCQPEYVVTVFHAP